MLDNMQLDVKRKNKKYILVLVFSSGVESRTKIYHVVIIGTYKDIHAQKSIQNI